MACRTGLAKKYGATSPPARCKAGPSRSSIDPTRFSIDPAGCSIVLARGSDGCATIVLAQAGIAMA